MPTSIEPTAKQYVDLGNVVGPQGPKGDKGDKGDPGDGGSLTYTIASVKSGPMATITSSELQNEANSTAGSVYIVIPNKNVVFDGRQWYGPYLINIKYYNGTTWTDVSQITGCQFNAGQAIFLWVKGNGSGIEECYLLNPPIPSTSADTWHTLAVNSSISTDFDPLTLYYKKSGDTVTVRFTGSANAELTADTLIATLPEGYRPTYAYDDGLPILTCNYYSGKITFCIYSNGSLYFTKSLNEGENMSDLGWNTTQFTFTV